MLCVIFIWGCRFDAFNNFKEGTYHFFFQYICNKLLQENRKTNKFPNSISIPFEKLPIVQQLSAKLPNFLSQNNLQLNNQTNTVFDT